MLTGAMNSLVRGGGSRSPGHSGRSRARTTAPFPSVPVLALLIGLLAVPQAAPAQTIDTLVSNTGQTTGTTFGGNFDLSQPFATGDASEGYTLTAVGVQMTINAGTLPVFALEIWTDSSGEPGQKAGTLENPDSFTTGTNSFAAPGDGIALNANTEYHIVLDVTTQNDLNSMRSHTTASGNEDPDAAPGWSISDTFLFHTHSTTTWSTPISGALKVEIQGYANDTTAPVLISGSDPAPAEAVTPTRIELRYNEPLDGDSVPAASAFGVTVGSNAAVNPLSVGVSGSAVTLVMASALSGSNTVTVTYTQPTGDAAKIRDNAGNAAAALSGQAVTIDNAAPALVASTTDVPNPTVTDTELALTFNEVLDEGSEPAASAFTVTVGGSSATVSAVEVSGSVVTLTLAARVNSGQATTVAYTKPTGAGANPLRDPFLNEVAAIAATSVTVVDGTPPANGISLTIFRRFLKES